MPLHPFHRTLSLVAVLVCCLVVNAADTKRRAFGPEWKKVDPQSDLGKFGIEYERTVNVPIRHSYGNVASFEVPLECSDTVGVTEVDDNAGASVRIRSRDGAAYGGFEVAKDPKGKAESFTVTVGPNLYFDLDADGTFDAMYDHRPNSSGPKIHFEGKFIPVEDNKSVFRTARGQTLKVWGVGRGEAYEFAGGQWKKAR